jgi:hypothetical protein
MEERLIKKINYVISRLKKGEISKPLVIDLINYVDEFIQFTNYLAEESESENLELFIHYIKEKERISNIDRKLYAMGVHLSIVEAMSFEELLKAHFEKRAGKLYKDVKKDLYEYIKDRKNN